MLSGILYGLMPPTLSVARILVVNLDWELRLLRLPLLLVKPLS